MQNIYILWDSFDFITALNMLFFQYTAFFEAIYSSWPLVISDFI